MRHHCMRTWIGIKKVDIYSRMKDFLGYLSNNIADYGWEKELSYSQVQLGKQEITYLSTW